MAEDTQEGSGRNGPVGGPEPALRGGGLPLPGLQHWRQRRGISQAELAKRADLTPDYLFKVESGRRGCNPEAAQRLADLLEVDLQDLRRSYESSEAESMLKPSRRRVGHRHVHQAYLRIILEGAVGSAYAAMDEWELEKRLGEGGWGEVLDALRAREQEIGVLGEMVEAKGLLRDRDLPEEVRSFLRATLESYPDLDIRLLAAARRREASGEGHEALTKAMRELLT